jgi:hypothetical protein
VTLAIAAMASAAALPVADYGKVTVHKAAEGVYLFTTSPYGDVGMCGNSIADWLKALEGFADLNPAIIIPGHGLARSDPGFLRGSSALPS